MKENVPDIKHALYYQGWTMWDDQNKEVVKEPTLELVEDLRCEGGIVYFGDHAIDCTSCSIELFEAMTLYERCEPCRFHRFKFVFCPADTLDQFAVEWSYKYFFEENGVKY